MSNRDNSYSDNVSDSLNMSDDINDTSTLFFAAVTASSRGDAKRKIR